MVLFANRVRSDQFIVQKIQREKSKAKAKKQQWEGTRAAST